MDELQKVRADWIAAQEKILLLERANADLTKENYTLQMRLNFAQCQATIMKSLYDGLWQGLFVKRS